MTSFISLEKPIAISEQIWSEDTIPLVAIGNLTYNHSNYITDAIDSFLMQKTTFPVKIVIFDDCSTDGTSEIIYSYQKKFPHLFTLIRPSENTWEKPEERKQALSLYYEARNVAKYIALCEGDDYWTDPLKLQKQVDFLEENPSYTITCGGFMSRHQYNKTFKTIIRQTNTKTHEHKNGYAFRLKDTYKNWMTKTLTVTFVNDKEVLSNFQAYNNARDVHLIYHLLKRGNGFYFTEPLGVYRIHSGGVHSMVDECKRTVGAYFIYKELYDKNKDEFTRKYNLNYHLILLNLKIFNTSCLSQYNLNTSHLLKETFKLLKKPSDILMLFQVFLPKELKARTKRIFSK